MARPAQLIELLGPVAGLFGRLYEYEEPGDFILGHTHHFDHAVLVLRGRVRIDRDGVTEDVGAGRMVAMPAGARHTIRALTDNAASICLFAVPREASDLAPWTE